MSTKGPALEETRPLRAAAGEPGDATRAPGRSYVVGLIGAGIGQSRSPLLHEREAAAQGLHHVYKLIDLDALGLGPGDLPRVLEAMEITGFAGANVTHPCKHAVVPHLHALSPEAEAIGAVNTVVFALGRRIGHNTDSWGFAESFRRGLATARRDRVVMLGAGGAGAAVGLAMLELGARELILLDTDRRRATDLAARLNDRHAGRVTVGDDAAGALARADGLINATPVGMAGHPGMPVDSRLLRPEIWVAEIVYVPLETQLVAAARGRGCRVLDGGGMAVFQAARAFRLFAGVEPDIGRMLAHFAAL